MLSVRNISHNIGNRRVLDGVSLDVHPGEFTALLGPNGTGKTTLLRYIAGELDARSGVVELNGTPLTHLSLEQQARQRAVLTQGVSVAFDFTVEEVVMLGRSPYHGEEPRSRATSIARAALRYVGAEHFSHRRVRTLSGGETQRVHLARAITQVWQEGSDLPPRYLLLDEPSSALDVAWQHEILGQLRDLASQGFGVLAILHDLNLAAQYADRLIFLGGGKVQANGAPDDVLTPALIHQVYGVCASVCRHPTHPCPLVVQHGLQSPEFLQHSSKDQTPYLERTLI